MYRFILCLLHLLELIYFSVKVGWAVLYIALLFALYVFNVWIGYFEHWMENDRSLYIPEVDDQITFVTIRINVAIEYNI